MSAELDDLRATVRAFLAEECPPAEVRRLMADPAAHDEARLRRLSAELGLTGFAIAEEYGGAGCGMIELAVL